jgi:hypothetical protein
VHAHAVRGSEPYAFDLRLAAGDRGVPRLGNRLAQEDQRVLREIDEER